MKHNHNHIHTHTHTHSPHLSEREGDGVHQVILLSAEPGMRSLFENKRHVTRHVVNALVSCTLERDPGAHPPPGVDLWGVCVREKEKDHVCSVYDFKHTNTLLA